MPYITREVFNLNKLKCFYFIFVLKRLKVWVLCGDDDNDTFFFLINKIWR